MAYADSLTAVSADSFRFSSNTTYPNVMHDFEKSSRRCAPSCDILLTRIRKWSDLWKRIERRDQVAMPTLVDSTACRRLADTSRANLEKRVRMRERRDSRPRTRTRRAKSNDVARGAKFHECSKPDTPCGSTTPPELSSSDRLSYPTPARHAGVRILAQGVAPQNRVS